MATTCANSGCQAVFLLSHVARVQGYMNTELKENYRMGVNGCLDLHCKASEGKVEMGGFLKGNLKSKRDIANDLKGINAL